MAKRELICGIYKITSPTGKIYIGQSFDCLKRSVSYERCRCAGQPRIAKSIKKHGWENHTFEIIHVCESTISCEELDNLEKLYIKKFDSFNTEHGLNLTEGGSNGRMSEETKIKQSVAAKGKPKSEAHRENTRLANLGKKHTEDTRKKMSSSHLGKKQTEECKKKCRENKTGEKNPMYGKDFSKEHREKLRLASLRNGNKPPIMCGPDNPMYGKKMSPETKEKLRIANIGKKHSVETLLKKSQSAKRNWAKRKLNKI